MGMAIEIAAYGWTQPRCVNVVVALYIHRDRPPLVVVNTRRTSGNKSCSPGPPLQTRVSLPRVASYVTFQASTWTHVRCTIMTQSRGRAG